MLERNSNRIVARLLQEGWELVAVKGSHHKFRKVETGLIIVVPHPKKDLPVGTARNIAKHAGWLKE